MRTILIIVAVWCIVSIPVGVLVGKWIAWTGGER